MLKNDIWIFICEAQHVVHIAKRRSDDDVVSLIDEVSDVVAKLSSAFGYRIHVRGFNASCFFCVLTSNVVRVVPSSVTNWCDHYECRFGFWA